MKNKGRLKGPLVFGVALLLLLPGLMSCATASASTKTDLEKRVDALAVENAQLQKRVDELERKLALLESLLPQTARSSQGAPARPSSAAPSATAAPSASTATTPIIQSPGMLPPPPGLAVVKVRPPAPPAAPPVSPESPGGSPYGEQPPSLFAEDPTFSEPSGEGSQDPATPPSAGAHGAPSAPSAGPPISVEAATLYESAMGQFQKGEIEMAIEAFKLYLTKYPDSSYVPNAMFYLGESFYKTRKYQQAMENYRRLLMKYPESESAPEALFKLGMCFLQLSDIPSAKQAFNRVVESYPYSEAAKSAQAELKKLE